MVTFDSSQLFPTAYRQSQLLLSHKFWCSIFQTAKKKSNFEMKQIIDLSPLLLLSSFYLLFIPGLADTSATSSKDQNTSSKTSSGTSTWLEVLLICLGLVAVGAFSVFLFKLWQRKKREEQHARLLRLFEQDDELEVELGIRD